MLLVVIARLFLYTGIAIVVGDITVRVSGVFEKAGDIEGRERRLVATGWFALFIAVSMLLLAQARDLELEASWSALQSLLADTTWGRGWLLLAVSSVVGFTAWRNRWPAAVECVAVAVLAVSLGGMGHAAADEGWPISARVLDGLHVIGVGAWLGGLLFVSRRARHEHQREAWASFSRIATIAAPVVVLTGFGASLRRVAGTTASVAYASDYGRLLLIKIALACVVLAFGARHRRQTIARQTPGTGSVRAELLFAVLVFVVTSVLTGTAPPGE